MSSFIKNVTASRECFFLPPQREVSSSCVIRGQKEVRPETIRPDVEQVSVCECNSTLHAPTVQLLRSANVEKKNIESANVGWRRLSTESTA